MEVQKQKIKAEKEYDALRAEILKRLEFRFNIVALLIAVVSAVLGFGLKNNPTAILLLPPIICVIAMFYRGNIFMIIKIGSYLRQKYEGEESELGWETYHTNSPIKGGKWTWNLTVLVNGVGIFFVFSIISIVVGVFQTKLDQIGSFLLIIDFFSLIPLLFAMGDPIIKAKQAGWY